MELEFVTKSDLKAFAAKLDRILTDLELIKTKAGLSQHSTWLDNEDVMKLLHISPRTLQTWRDNGLIPFSKIGAKLYYREEDLQKLLKENLSGGWQAELKR